MNKIKVMIVEPNKLPYIKTIDTTLKSYQEIVGGNIEIILAEKGCLLVINDEGKINGSPLNRCFGDTEAIFGTFFICSEDDNGEFISLPEEMIFIANRIMSNTPTLTPEEVEKLRVTEFEVL